MSWGLWETEKAGPAGAAAGLRGHSPVQRVREARSGHRAPRQAQALGRRSGISYGFDFFVVVVTGFLSFLFWFSFLNHEPYYLYNYNTNPETC